MVDQLLNTNPKDKGWAQADQAAGQNNIVGEATI
jgi:hypothetical protein